MSSVEVPAAAVRSRSRRPTWQLAVSALLVLWLGAQSVAGWKFANSQTYPIVGSGMFSGPPNPDSPDFMVPRVFGFTSAGSRIEIDHHTFDLEPFEWRRWIKRNLEVVTQQRADSAGADLADTYASRSGHSLSRLELWRIPALTDDFERGRLLRSVEL